MPGWAQSGNAPSNGYRIGWAHQLGACGAGGRPNMAHLLPPGSAARGTGTRIPNPLPRRGTPNGATHLEVVCNLGDEGEHPVDQAGGDAGCQPESIGDFTLDSIEVAGDAPRRLGLTDRPTANVPTRSPQPRSARRGSDR
jgi:hypothetical protein